MCFQTGYVYILITLNYDSVCSIRIIFISNALTKIFFKATYDKIKIKELRLMIS